MRIQRENDVAMSTGATWGTIAWNGLTAPGCAAWVRTCSWRRAHEGGRRTLQHDACRLTGHSYENIQCELHRSVPLSM